MRQLFHHWGLTIVLSSLFVLILAGQAVAGWRSFNEEQRQYRRSEIGFGAYLQTGHFIGSTAENWESEFLQMGVFVALTAFLHQKGSPESKDPDKNRVERPVTPGSPWPARRGGWIKTLYSASLSIAFGLLFVASFWLHAAGSHREYNREQTASGEPPVSLGEFLTTGEFWFQSLQNWQSEFLAIVSMVVLGIFLRQKGSPESKDVATPTWEHDD
jgi:hypothetical protein